MSPSEPRRRDVLAGGLALAGGALMAGPLAAASPVRTDVLSRALAFAALLSPAALQAASYPFGGRTHRGWNYFGARTKPGLRLEQMTRDQQEAALALLATLLSPAGMDKFDRVHVLQEVLAERGAGPADRNADRFSFALFGAPSPSELWGLRVEGHHLSLSFTMAGAAVVAVTPSSFSSNPNEVVGGRHDGLVALVEEHALAARLMRDLSPRNAARARITDRAYRNILTTAGREERLFGAPREGVPLADLTAAQREVAMRIVDAYAVDHLAGPLAEEQAARVRSGDPDGIRFAWGGSTRVGELMSTACMAPRSSSSSPPIRPSRSTSIPSATTRTATSAGTWPEAKANRETPAFRRDPGESFIDFGPAAELAPLAAID